MPTEAIDVPSLEGFYAEGLITEVVGRLKSGKEATVYCCRAHPATGAALLAAKVYRPLAHRAFKNDAVYQQGRVILDARTRRAYRKKTRRGRGAQFGLWLGRRAPLLKVKKRPGSPVGVYFHQRVKAAGVPVPELVAFDASAGPDGQACAIWQWIDGRPVHWGPSEPCPYDEAEFGELLRRVHDLRCDGPFGCLGDDPSNRTFSYTPDLPPTSRTWSGYFRFDLAAKRFRDKGYFDRRQADVLASLPDRLSGELDRAQPRLLHMGDVMHHGNMILHPRTGRILAVLDYVESMVGDPRWELAWLDYYFSQCPFNGALFDMARFRAAYGTNHDPDDPVGRFYLAAVLLFEKLLSAKPDEPPGRWAIETVKDIIKRSVDWA